jgi:hypothetical protein
MVVFDRPSLPGASNQFITVRFRVAMFPARPLARGALSTKCGFDNPRIPQSAEDCEPSDLEKEHLKLRDFENEE